MRKVYAPSTAMSRDLIDVAGRLRTAIVPLFRRLRQQLADDSFTPTQLSVLGTIHRHGPLSLGDLALRERLSLPTISKVVAALELAGVAERLSDERDRRVCLVRTTVAGGRWIDDSRARRDTWLAERLARLDDEERATLEAALPILERLTEER